MFNIGITELLLILALALIVVGPQKLPGIARSLGKAFGEFKNATRDFKNVFETEAGLSEKPAHELENSCPETRQPEEEPDGFPITTAENESIPADKKNSEQPDTIKKNIGKDA